MVGRRGLLLAVLGGAFLGGASPTAAQPEPRPRRRRKPPPSLAPPPAEVTSPTVPPPIDRPALQPIGPGAQPAPMPATNAQGPMVDRQPRPSIAFGVPTPPLFGQGETFTRPDSMSETRPQPGIRLPSPGATLRLPLW